MQTVVKKIDLERPHVKPRPHWYATIPSELCMKCADCGTYWDLRADCCDCGSKAGLNVTKALDRRGIEVTR